MTTIVMNTANGAVTEYDWNFDSVSPKHACSDAGLFELSEDADADVSSPIDAQVLTGNTLLADSHQKFVDTVFFAMRGVQPGDQGTLLVNGEGTSYSYQFGLRPKGVSRAQPGRGIKENYLAVGFANLGGADFTLDNIEVPLAPSKTRRST